MRLGVDEASWLPTAYNMALVFMGILSVHLGAIFGQRKILLIASVVSATAFLFASFAPNRVALILLLIVAGLGVGTFYPLILGFLLKALPLPLAVFGLAVYVIDVLVPSYMGQWSTGIISSYLSWHWVFWIPALVIPFVFLFVYFGIPRAEANYGGTKPTFTGFFYGAWGFALFYGAIDQGERLGLVQFRHIYWTSSGKRRHARSNSRQTFSKAQPAVAPQVSSGQKLYHTWNSTLVLPLLASHYESAHSDVPIDSRRLSSTANRTGFVVGSDTTDSGRPLSCNFAYKDGSAPLDRCRICSCRGRLPDVRKD
jgi:hypothetical protein